MVIKNMEIRYEPLEISEVFINLQNKKLVKGIEKHECSRKMAKAPNLVGCSLKRRPKRRG